MSLVGKPLLTVADFLRSSLENVCANCDLYSWEQKEGKITLRCGGCKTFFYCGEDCQKEHWRKAHKQHCKHLSKLKKTAYSSKQELDADLDLLSSVTTVPDDRIERVIIGMQRLLEKIKLTKQSSTETAEIVKVDNRLLVNNRLQIYVNRLKEPKAGSAQASLDLGGLLSFSELCDAAGTFNFLLWILVQLCLINTEGRLKSPEKSLPTKWREASTKIREGPFLRIVDEIMEHLDGQVIPPHSKLVNIACGGNMARACAVCQKEITVTTMWLGGVTVPPTASVVLFPLEGVFFTCGSEECEEKLPERVSWNDWNMFCAVVKSTVARLNPTRCDFCFLCAPLLELQRSLCRTKNYCSKICRDADDSVHKVCCDQGQQVEERKVKTGGKEKREVADTEMKSSTSRTLSVLEERPEQFKTSDSFKEMLKYNTKLMEKIQLKENQKLKEMGQVDEID